MKSRLSLQILIHIIQVVPLRPYQDGSRDCEEWSWEGGCPWCLCSWLWGCSEEAITVDIIQYIGWIWSIQFLLSSILSSPSFQANVWRLPAPVSSSHYCWCVGYVWSIKAPFYISPTSGQQPADQCSGCAVLGDMKQNFNCTLISQLCQCCQFLQPQCLLHDSQPNM